MSGNKLSLIVNRIASAADPQYVLDLDGGFNDDGTTIFMFTRHGGKNHHWTAIPGECSSFPEGIKFVTPWQSLPGEQQVHNPDTDTEPASATS